MAWLKLGNLIRERLDLQKVMFLIYKWLEEKLELRIFRSFTKVFWAQNFQSFEEFKDKTPHE